MIRKNLNTPLWQLTVGEFLDMVESLHKEPQPVMLNQETYVYGIAGIAKLFGCSKPTDSLRLAFRSEPEVGAMILVGLMATTLTHLDDEVFRRSRRIRTRERIEETKHS